MPILERCQNLAAYFFKRVCRRLAWFAHGKFSIALLFHGKCS
uniref:Uncharacterized protein n=1 Tax=Arundo donax TaxID=35708 RepID=A0A0A9GTT7_ARUDO